MKTKADLQMRLAEIKIRGYIKDWDEFLLLYMIMTGQIDMPEGALFEAGTRQAYDIKTRGLFNPLRHISDQSVKADKIKKFAQHFPMLLRAGESPTDAMTRLHDWLYNTDRDASTWMELINGTRTIIPAGGGAGVPNVAAYI